VVRLAGGRAVHALAATSARRAARLLKVAVAQVVAGAPAELLALVQGSTLKLERVRVVVLAWVDEVIAGGEEAMLETLMAEVPKEAARVVVANEITSAVEAVIERYARRARRVAPVAEGAAEAGIPIQYVSVSSASRLPALRRLLDDLDPVRGIVYVRTDDSERDVQDLLRALGYGDSRSPEAPGVRVARAAGAGESDVVVLYDIPASREELREAVGAQPRRVVALAQPRLLASLRVLAGGAPVTPFTLSEAGIRARSREETVRAELRDTLSSSAFARELLTLEPLLDSYDGIEIAAATLRLLEQARFERDAARARAVESRPHAIAVSGGAMTRIFVNVGAMDNARPGDLVGAITNEAGITSAQVGKIDIRENHSLVEVASEVAESVVSKITGGTIRGRRIVARIDQERGTRGAGRGRASAGGGRGTAERGDRPVGGTPRRDGGFRREGGRGAPPSREPADRGSDAPERRNDDTDRAARPPHAGDNE
jgi:ATP-dependent RNA helicase DeaD